MIKQTKLITKVINALRRTTFSSSLVSENGHIILHHHHIFHLYITISRFSKLLTRLSVKVFKFINTLTSFSKDKDRSYCN